MRKILTLLGVVLQLHASAQFKTIATSESFPEQQGGFVKLLVLPNGNTAHAQLILSGMAGMPFGPKNAGTFLDLTIYGADHKQIIKKKITVDPERMLYDFTACFNVNNDIVVLFGGLPDSRPTIKRMVINGSSGNIMSQELLAETPQMTKKDRQAFVAYHLYMPFFIAKKDPFSDNYALMYFSYPNGDGSSNYTIMHFDASHKTLSKAILKTPGNKFAFIDVLDIAVVSDKQVEVLDVGYNTTRTGGKDNQTFITTIKAGGEQSFTSLNNKTDKLTQHGLLRYNPVTDQLLALTLNKGATENNFLGANVMHYNVLLAAFNEKTKEDVGHSFDINVEDINQTYRDYFSKRKSFGGVPENLIVNRDGSFCILLEGLEQTVQGNGAGRFALLKDLAVLYYDKDFHLQSSSLVPKSHNYYYVEPLYMADRDVRPTNCVMGYQYKSSTFLNGKNKNYILMNDIQSNATSAPNGRITTISGVGECDAFSFDVSAGAKPLPDRQLVFGDKGGHSLGFFSASAYDATNNVLVTLQIDRDKGDKMSRVVWLQGE